MFSNSSILIFTDLDGTLLNRDTFKFDSIKTFLKELKKKNIIMNERDASRLIFENNLIETYFLCTPGPHSMLTEKAYFP